jgi:uncharacterized cupin superfamily protein
MAEQTPKDPIVNIADLEFIPFGHGHERPGAGQAHPRYQGSMGQIGERVGAQKLGYNLTVVPPGKRVFPLHSHRVNEEMFFILEGSGEVRIGKGAPPRPIRAGDVIACPPGGPETAHQIINTSDAELKFLAVSTKIYPEIADYPDFGTFAVYGADPPFRFVTRHEHGLTYWQDEEEG